MMSLKRKKTVEIIAYAVSSVTTIVAVSALLVPHISPAILIIESLFLIAFASVIVAYFLKEEDKGGSKEEVKRFRPENLGAGKASGKLTLEFPEQEAVTVSIELQLVKKKSTAADASGKIFNVLVVDDNLTNQLLVCSSLEKLGCKISKAFNGAQAVKAVTQSSFDLILMDLKMPVMSGFDATKKIRQIDSLNVNTPIVALTPAPDSMNKKECKELGMNGCLAKPVSKKSVRRLLELLEKEAISWQEID